MTDNEVIEELKARAKEELMTNPNEQSFLSQVLQYITRIAITYEAEREVLKAACIELREKNTQLTEELTKLKSLDAKRVAAMKQIQSNIKAVTKSIRETRRKTASEIVKMIEKGKDTAAIAKKYKTGGKQ